MTRDYRPSKQFNSKLSLETHKQIEALRSPELPTQRAVIEKAIAALHEAVMVGTLITEALEPVDYGAAKGETLRSQPTHSFGDGSGSTGTATQTGENTFKVSPRTIRLKGENHSSLLP